MDPNANRVRGQERPVYDIAIGGALGRNMMFTANESSYAEQDASRGESIT